MAFINRQPRIQWFAQLAERTGIPLDPVLNLMAEVPISDSYFEQIRQVTERYIRACFGNRPGLPSSQALVDLAGQELANRTPNGILVPKREFQSEFNQFNSVMASWLRTLNIDDLIYKVCTPITIRLMKGESVPEEDERPFSSSKLHTDFWAGEPFDYFAIQIPILGDIDRTTIDWYHPPDDFEENYFYRMNDYSEGKALEGRCQKYPSMRMGYAYFADGMALHQTVKKGGGARSTIQMMLRRTTSDQERHEAEAASHPGRLALDVALSEWYEYGTSKFMRFKDTYADAAKGVFIQRPFDEPTYELVDSF